MICIVMFDNSVFKQQSNFWITVARSLIAKMPHMLVSDTFDGDNHIKQLFVSYTLYIWKGPRVEDKYSDRYGDDHDGDNDDGDGNNYDDDGGGDDDDDDDVDDDDDGDDEDPFTLHPSEAILSPTSPPSSFSLCSV